MLNFPVKVCNFAHYTHGSSCRMARLITGLIIGFWSCLPQALVLAQHTQETLASDTTRARLIIQTGHGRGVTGISSATFSADGQLLLTTALSDRRVVMWDVETGRQLRAFFGHGSSVTNTAFSTDSTRIASSSLDGTVRIWDARSGKQLRILHNDSHGIAHLVRSVNGSLLAFADDSSHVYLVEWLSAGEVSSFDLEADATALAFNASSTMLAVATEQSLHLIDIGTHERKATLTYSGNTARMIRFSRNDDALVIVTADGELRRVDINSHTDNILQPKQTTISISNDANFALMSDEKGLGEIWDVDQGQTVRKFFRPIADSLGVFSPNGAYVFTVSEQMNRSTIVEVASGRIVQQIETLAPRISDMRLSMDERYLLVGRHDSSAVLWDLHKGKVTNSYPVEWDDFASAVAFGFDKTVWIGAHSGHVSMWLQDREVEVTIRSFDRFARIGIGLKGLHISPDRTWQIIQSMVPKVNPFVRKFDGYTNVIGEGAFPTQERISEVFGFSRKGNYLLTNSLTHGAVLWNGTSLEMVRNYAEHTDLVKLGAISPDEELVATVDLTGALHVWTAASAAPVCKFVPLQHEQELVQLITFSGDGRTIIAEMAGTASRWTIQLFDAHTCIKKTTYDGHATTITAMVTIGRNILATASHDGFIKVWDFIAGKELCRLAVVNNDWIVVTPGGYFDASKLSELKGVHWVRPEKPFTPIDLVAYARSQYRPNLLGAVLSGEWIEPEDQSPPAPNHHGATAIIQNIRLSPDAKKADITLRLNAGALAGPLSDATARAITDFKVQLFRNDVLITSVRGSIGPDGGWQFAASDLDSAEIRIDRRSDNTL